MDLTCSVNDCLGVVNISSGVTSGRGTNGPPGVFGFVTFEGVVRVLVGEVNEGMKREMEEGIGVGGVIEGIEGFTCGAGSVCGVVGSID